MKSGGPFGNKKFFESLTAPKKSERGTLYSRPVLEVTFKSKKWKEAVCNNLHAFPRCSFS